MSYRYALYDENGNIYSIGMCSDPIDRPTKPHIEIDDTVNFATHYVEDGRIKEKPKGIKENHRYNAKTKNWDFDEKEETFDLRFRRNILLQACDWTQLPDVPIETKTAWAAYRQALRDITEQPGFPAEVEWPEPPT